MFELIDQSKYRLISFDIPGFLGYSKSNSINETKDVVQLAKRIIAQLIKGKYIIAGYSYGGLVASEIGVLDSNVESILLVSPLLDSLLLRKKIVTKVYSLLKNYVSNERIAEYFFAMTGKNVSKSKNENYNLLEYYKEEIKKIDFKNAINILLSDSGFSLTKDNLNKKTLAVFADSEPGFIKSSMKQLRDSENCRIEIIRNTNHNHLFFEPEKSIVLITEFLDSSSLLD